jgi:D-alanine-D-alanine ligase-like ATP-grasp enzyme
MLLIYCYNLNMQATKKRVGILRGGAGKHYTSSLKKGGEIISYITDNLGDKYKVLDILVDKDGVWHFSGKPIKPSDLFHKVDVVWNTAEPSASVILNNFSIPNVVNGAFFLALENNSEMLKKHIKMLGIQTPRLVVSPKNAKEVLQKFPAPWIVKNYNEIRVVKTFDELGKIINDSDSLIVEEFIAGKVASIHTVPGFRGDLPALPNGREQAGDIYTFPLGNAFGIFSAGEKEKLINLAKDLHKHLGAKHYLKSDFVLNPQGRVYLLQIESTPDLKIDSHFSQVCESVGAKTHHVIEHILEMA